MTDCLLTTDLPLANRREGKVRDIYDATLPDGSDGLLLIATDRLSAFDVIMQNGIPGRGIVLTQISRFWFEKFADLVPHHLISTEADDIVGLTPEQRQPLQNRIKLCRKTRVIPIECVVRGYLAGSGWAEYQANQQVCGIALPVGLRQCDRLPEPIFTPATKAESGHDENISFQEAADRVGETMMGRLREISIDLYTQAREYAANRGIIIADTKFEFGISLDGPDGELVLIDEILTPDSSRFWPAERYEPGRDQNSFDKQYVRNYLQSLCDAGTWDKTPPGPVLPNEIIANTLAKYLEAYRLLTGRTLTV